MKPGKANKFLIQSVAFLIAIQIIFSGLPGCKKLNSFPDAPIEITENTVIIMHRGGGNSGAGRNTLEGAIYGMSVAGGIELDLQMSQDNTPWVEHDSRIPGCGGKDEACFVSLRDWEIEERNGCGDFYTIRLEAIFKEASKIFPEAIIVLDCKAWSPCGLSEMNAARSMKKMGREVIDLARKYNIKDNIIFDSNVKSFLKEIDKHSDIKIYYRSFSSLDKTARNAFDVNADGVSLDQKRYHLTDEDIQLLNRKGLEVQLWTIDDSDELDEVLSLKPQQVLSEVNID